MLSLVDNKKWKIIGFFLDNPTEEIHLRALSRKLKVSPTWITKKLKEFEKFDLIKTKKNRESRLLSLNANRDSQSFRRLKISFNLYQIYQSGLLEELIKVYHKPECIILFGSYSKGEDIEESDIDIAVITSRNIKKNWAMLEKKLKRKIKIHELKKGRIESDFMDTLANGVVLYGYLETK